MKDLIKIIGEIWDTEELSYEMAWHHTQHLIVALLSEGVPEKDLECHLEELRRKYVLALRDYIVDDETFDCQETWKNIEISIIDELKRRTEGCLESWWYDYECCGNYDEEGEMIDSEYSNDDEERYYEDNYWSALKEMSRELDDDDLMISMAMIIVDLNRNGVEDAVNEFMKSIARKENADDDY